MSGLDYRVPQMLCTLGCLKYSPRLDYHIRQLKPIKSGDTWETELRGKSPIVFSTLFQNAFRSLLFVFRSSVTLSLLRAGKNSGL